MTKNMHYVLHIQAYLPVHLYVKHIHILLNWSETKERIF